MKLKHLNLKLTQTQHDNLKLIADEYGMNKSQVAIVCIDLGCQSIAAVADLKVKEMSKLAQTFASYGIKIDPPEVADQDDDNT